MGVAFFPRSVLIDRIRLEVDTLHLALGCGFVRMVLHRWRNVKACLCATLLIQQGVQLRVVMEILGHSSITATAAIYAHVMPETQRDAAAKLDALFPADDDSRSMTP